MVLGGKHTNLKKKNVDPVHGHTMEYNGNQKSRGLVSFHRQGKKKKKKKKEKKKGKKEQFSHVKIRRQY